MVVVIPGRDEGGLGAIASLQGKAEHAAIEGESPVEIGDLEMDMANPRLRMDRVRGRCHEGSRS